MSKLKIKNGNILEAEEQAICHQCNCVTTYAAGLADDIFKKYPWANVYKKNMFRPAGTVIVSRNIDDIINNLRTLTVEKKDEDTKDCFYYRRDPTENERVVVNIFGQIYPGKSKYKNGKDSVGQRIKYFKKALDELEKLHYIDAPGIGRDFYCNGYAFPYKIGCNRAGGDWNIYYQAIEKFAESMDVPVTIYKL